MISKENIIHRIHLWNQKIKNASFVARDYHISSNYIKLKKIIAFVGARRVGKTTLMIQYIHELIKEKIISREQVVFLDCTDLLNQQIDVQDIITGYKQLYPNTKPWFFFDEIQNLNNFMNMILSLYTQDYNIFITGSNSKVLSSELATELRGRSIDIKVYPLSCKEYLIFQNYPLHDINEEDPLYRHHVNNYITRWGYPEIALNPNNSIQYTLITNYLESLIYKDLQERYKIRSLQTLQHLVKKIIISNTKWFSIHKIYNELKSLGISISKDTLYNYMHYIYSAFFYNEVVPYLKPNGQAKLYLNDRAYMNLNNEKKNLWQKRENIVYNHLTQHQIQCHYISHPSYELDFLTTSGEAIQACHTVTLENQKREIKPFWHKDLSTTKHIIATPFPLEKTTKLPSSIPIMTYKDMVEYNRE